MPERDVHDGVYRHLAATRVSASQPALAPNPPGSSGEASPARSTLLPRLALLRPRAASRPGVAAE